MADSSYIRRASASDPEKLNRISSKPVLQPEEPQPLKHGLAGLFQRFERQLVLYNLEARGIRRVEPSERHDLNRLGYSQIGLLWFSVNLAANNITLGMLGPVVFGLSFFDACMTAVFGMLIGCLPVGYIAMFGPRSGNRSLVVARYSMGWWPAKLVVILNLMVCLGYAMIDAVVAGQILSAVSPNGSLSVVVGIVITALITYAVTLFGYNILHIYERYAWVPQLIAISILAGVSGPGFSLTTPTTGDARTRVGDRLSFFSLALSAAITYAGGAADFFVYFPEHTSRWKVFATTMAGLTTSFTYAFVIGIGLGSGVATNPAWASAYSVSQGALLVEGFAPLGAFGKFCSVVIVLGLIANMVTPAYCSGVDFQILGRYFMKVPRVLWNTFGVVVFTVCAIAGRAHLAEIFTNFLSLMGYWVSIWIAITLEEHFIFRRKSGFDWAVWDSPQMLPVGIAALIAFLVGWAGAILCMAQVWYIGPLARLVGEYGADVSRDLDG